MSKKKHQWADIRCEHCGKEMREHGAKEYSTLAGMHVWTSPREYEQRWDVYIQEVRRSRQNALEEHGMFRDPTAPTPELAVPPRPVTLRRYRLRSNTSSENPFVPPSERLHVFCGEPWVRHAERVEEPLQGTNVVCPERIVDVDIHEDCGRSWNAHEWIGDSMRCPDRDRTLTSFETPVVETTETTVGTVYFAPLNTEPVDAGWAPGGPGWTQVGTVTRVTEAREHRDEPTMAQVNDWEHERLEEAGRRERLRRESAAAAEQECQNRRGNFSIQVETVLEGPPSHLLLSEMTEIRRMIERVRARVHEADAEERDGSSEG